MVALIGFWSIKGFIRRSEAAEYDKLAAGALVSDATTLRWLGLKDKRWYCKEPHYKGRLLHLRHKIFQAKDVIVFVHGFIGDYVSTWGNPKVLLEDARFNRSYDFVFYGFRTALFADVPAFDEEAANFDRTLSRLEQEYKSVTIVTHSKGGLLAMRTLLNRAKEFPEQQPYKIHRIVMFTPLTENVSLAQLPEFVKLLGKESPDIAQMQADTYSELGRVKEDLKALLDPQDPIAQTRKEAFMKNVAEHLYVINAEKDEIVDVGPNGEKIISENLRKLSELPSAGPPRLVTLRYLDIGGTDRAENPAYAHGIVVKMGGQQDFLFSDHFEELLYDRIGTPSRNSGANGEQIQQAASNRIDHTVFEMNKFVLDQNPMVGLAWRNISDAVLAKYQDLPEPARDKQIRELTTQIYYIYIFLDLYAQMDDLRSRGIMSPNDQRIVEWKHGRLPNLMKTELGRWMLQNNLMEYYSDQMVKDLREAAATDNRMQSAGGGTR